ncbi:Protein AE7, partial [Zea mays]
MIFFLRPVQLLYMLLWRYPFWTFLVLVTSLINARCNQLLCCSFQSAVAVTVSATPFCGCVPPHDQLGRRILESSSTGCFC